MPLSHPSLKELKKDQRPERYFWEEKEKLLEIGNRVSESNKCLFLYHEILMSKPKSFNLDHKENFEQKNKVDTEKYKRYCFGRTMANNVDYSFDGKFEGNIFIVGQSGCEKQLLYKTWQKMECLKILKKRIGYQKYLFPWKEKKI